MCGTIALVACGYRRGFLAPGSVVTVTSGMQGARGGYGAYVHTL